MIADLDTLLIALYVELVDRIIPARGTRRRGPGRPPVVTDAELVCLAVAQVLLRYNDEHHWLRAARSRVGHLFPRLLGQSEYNQRLKDAAPLMEAALRWLAQHTPGSAELLRLLDGTPVGCGQSKITTQRSNLFGWAGYGYETSHSRYYWGVKLMLVTTDGRPGPRRRVPRAGMIRSTSSTYSAMRRVSRSAAPVNLSEAGFLGNHCVVAVSSFGSLIHTAVGSAGGVGGLRTKRSGCSA